MNPSLGRAHVWLLACALVLVACGTTTRERGRARQRVTPAPAAAQPGVLYTADEALRDALSGPWQYVGTGRWPGINRMYACAFHNQRVLLVDVYCGLKERQAFRLEVYSLTRGHLRIYAETRGLVSQSRSQDYFTFMVESEPPLGAGMPQLGLELAFPELRRYEEQRYGAYLPACFAGRENGQPRSGCLGALAVHSADWAARNRPFLEHASDDWSRVMRELNTLAARHGREPD